MKLLIIHSSSSPALEELRLRVDLNNERFEANHSSLGSQIRAASG